MPPFELNNICTTVFRYSLDSRVVREADPGKCIVLNSFTLNPYGGFVYPLTDAVVVQDCLIRATFVTLKH